MQLLSNVLNRLPWPFHAHTDAADEVIADIRANRYDGAEGIAAEVAARYQAIAPKDRRERRAYVAKLTAYAAHMEDKAAHHKRLNSALDEMRSVRGASVRTGLTLAGVRLPAQPVWPSVLREAALIGRNKGGRYSDIRHVPIVANYSPLSLVLHESGEASLRYFCHEVMAAKTEILVQTFIYAQSSPHAIAFVDTLLNKQQQLAMPKGFPQKPVRVVLAVSYPQGIVAPRIMEASEAYGFTGSGSFTDWKGTMDEGPGDESYKLANVCDKLNARLIDFTVVGLEHFGRSLHHKKQAAFDGERAWIPTHNFAGPHSPSRSASGELLPSVRDIAQSFAGGTAPAAVHNDIIRSCNKWGHVLMTSRAHEMTDKDITSIKREVLTMAALPKRRTGLAEIIIAQQDVAPSWLDIASEGHLSPAYVTLRKMFASAKRSVRLMTPNFQIYDILAHLQEAMARGVVVKVLLTEKENAANSQLAGLTNEESVATLRQFVEAHGFQDRLEVRWNRETVPGSDERVAPEGWAPGAIHAKLYIIDGKVVASGSYNLDYQSFKSSEGLVLTNHPSDQNAFTKFFDAQHAVGAVQRRYPEEAERISFFTRTLATVLGARPGIGPQSVTDAQAAQFVLDVRQVTSALVKEPLEGLRHRIKALVEKYGLTRPENSPWLENLIDQLLAAPLPANLHGARDNIVEELRAHII